MKTSTIIVLVVGLAGVLYLMRDSIFHTAPVAKPSPTSDPSGAGQITAIAGGVTAIAGLFQDIMKKLPSSGQSNAATL